MDPIEETKPVRISLEPLDDHVVIEPVDEEAETRHGLIIPASAEAQSLSGIVTAVGPDVFGVGPGDKVLFPRGAGFEVRLAGVVARVMRRTEVIARIHD